MAENCTCLRERLAQGQTLLGGWIQIPHPAVARLMASSGFDWIAVDAEHGVVDWAVCSEVLLAIQAASSTPMVRMPGNVYDDTKRYLDAGAEGVIAPLVCSGEEAERLVRSSKYPPEGDRGVGYCAANLYGFEFDDYMARANQETTVCVQIEHADAIESLDAILSTPGVDAAFVGPYDLSASLGVTAQFDHPAYLDALKRFLRGCAEHGVAPGIHVIAPDADEVKRRADEGYRMIAYSLDVTLLGGACRDGIATVREALG
ncbi:MAG: 2,4-dihydroxyhept-2-ene-1,7-dioic acid aldolase [bacterium]|nr:2,4-dihydroxyhept-2-ene-1,7-dioic acid aldolase [bacterium]